MFMGKQVTNEGQLLEAIVAASHAYRGRLATIKLSLGGSRSVAGYERRDSCNGEVWVCMFREQTGKAGYIHVSSLVTRG